MRVILSIEAIRPPLAGIGRYAWELAQGLPRQAEVSEVRYIADGFWRAKPGLAQVQTPAAVATQAAAVRPGLRQRLAGSRLVSASYAQLQPLLTGWQANRLAKSVFHGPNFTIPRTRQACVVTIHDLSTYHNPAWHPANRVMRMNKVIPESLQRAQQIITVSESVRSELLQRFALDPDKVHAVLNGVDARYQPQTAAALSTMLQRYGLRYQGYSLFVSTIEPRKNLQNLLAAYRHLPLALRREFPLIIVGGRGWNSGDIHTEMQQAQHESWLKYLQYVPEQDLPGLYAAARLFVYPSWYEGFGLPIAEAMASGCPVLTSATSAMPEVAAGAALLVEPAELDSIRYGIVRGLTDESWRQQAIALGLQRVKKLTWESCIRETLGVYKKICD